MCRLSADNMKFIVYEWSFFSQPQAGKFIFLADKSNYTNSMGRILGIK